MLASGAHEQELQRLLLILDVDETLVHASESRLSRECDFLLGPYFIYERPHLRPFLARMHRCCDLAIWSSGGQDYVQGIVGRLFENLPFAPLFAWDARRCSSRFDGESHSKFVIKNLKKVKRRGFSLSRTLIVEDTPSKVSLNYGNAIYVSSYQGAADDAELLALARFIESLCDCPDVRRIEKRRSAANW